MSLAIDGPGGFPYMWEAFGIAGLVGGVIGAVLVPIIIWRLLRTVSFARILGVTALDTTVGGIIGFCATGFNPITAVVGAVGGFLFAAAWLRLQARTSPQ